MRQQHRGRPNKVVKPQAIRRPPNRASGLAHVIEGFTEANQTAGPPDDALLQDEAVVTGYVDSADVDPMGQDNLEAHAQAMDLRAANVLAGAGAGGSAPVDDAVALQHAQPPSQAPQSHHQAQLPPQQPHQEPQILQQPYPHDSTQSSAPLDGPHLPPDPSAAAAPTTTATTTNNLDPLLTRTTEDIARSSGYGPLAAESALARRLAHEPGLRHAQQRRPEQQLNLNRRSNVEALYAHIAGQLAPTPCKNCHKGHGPWTRCVVVDGQMCGSCANCWFNASGARCSFHETRNFASQNSIPLSHALLAGSAVQGVATDPSTAAYIAHDGLTVASGATAGGALASIALNLHLSNDPIARYTIDRAMSEVRAADQRARKLMQIEIAAKQLALHLMDYENFIQDASAAPQHGPQGTTEDGSHGAQ